MGYIFLIAVILALSISASQKGCGVKCSSSSCLYNRGGRCGRQEVTVYDNTVIGLCLNHTDSMKDRVTEPILKSGYFDSHKLKTNITVIRLKKTTEEMLDEKLLKNPNAFARWMRKQASGSRNNLARGKVK